MKKLRPLLAIVLFAGVGACAQGAPQTTAPEAPKPNQPVFALPSSSYALQPKAPVARKDDNTYCNAPQEGIYSRRMPAMSAGLQGQLHSYVRLIVAQVLTDWRSHMSVAEKNAWGTAKIATVRFAVMPDGTIDTPLLTRSTGKSQYDDKLLRAVRMNAPYATPPAAWGKAVPVCLSFGYHYESTDLMRANANDEWQDAQ